MNVSLFIARRISLKRDREECQPGAQRRSPAVGIAVAGIALSIAIMLVTVAIVPGFKHGITDKVMGFDAQIMLHPVQPVSGIGATDSQTIAVRMTPSFGEMLNSSLPEGGEAQLTVRQSGILKTEDLFAGLVFKSYAGGDTPGRFIATNLEDGVMPDYSVDSTQNDIVISRTTANELRLDVGDRVYGYFFTNDAIRTRRFTVAGIYNSHFNDYDKLLAFMSIDCAQSISGLDPDEGTSIEIRGIGIEDIPAVRTQVQQTASEAFYGNETNCYLSVNDIYEMQPMYFNWLDLLDTNVVVILILMGCVAAVTLISCLFIMILERVNMIGTLKSIGATDGMIARVFLWMAERVVLRGILLGDIIGLAIVFVQWKWAVVPLDPESYYLSSVPVEFNWGGIIVLNVTAAVIALVIMLLPTHMVSKISPARVLRFE